MGNTTTTAAAARNASDGGELAAALRGVPLFAPMPAADLADLARRGEAFEVEAGAYLTRAGEPAAWFFVLLDGEIRITKRTGTEERLLDTYQAGTYFGEVPILIGGPYVASGRATRRCRLFRLGADDFLHLLATREWTLREILRTMAGRLLNLQAFAQGRARLAALGTLAAGMAHELNNPAAAGRRAAGQLRPSVATLEEHAAALGPERLGRVRGLATEAAAAVAPPLDPLATSDREEALAGWLAERGIADGWELAPALAGAGLSADRLGALADEVGAGAFPAAVGWLAATLATAALLDAVEASAIRVSDLVGAMEDYTSLDRGLVQAVDVEAGLESTLAVLGHRLGEGVRVVRAYGRGLPRLEANGAELNQVWTNLLENAIDAIGEIAGMGKSGERGGGGTIRIATSGDDAGVVVEIADDGPGIPAAIQGRVFEPFFTTKPPGQGTGLGLDTVRRIVERHDGDVRIESRPGETRARVWLPLTSAAGGEPWAAGTAAGGADG